MVSMRHLFFALLSFLAIHPVVARPAVPAVLPPSVFAGLLLESTYRPSWNLLRLTGRELDASLETFSVSVNPNGTTFIMK